ncbi:glucose 1-dehydrogenase [Marispirochaeta aestuarii]|uniref:SDR family NAD(P)-dependent oxidoreductase n=1 Tax=Marispirochaeta aestuarii TaxID=1963862 RepID=UPI002ABDE6BE|nr:glucose 1-dehydrogenase [Marispirochaeta aestuarii]
MTTSMFDLSGKIALVTGASRGLGLAIAKALAEAGADLAATSRKESSLEGTCREIEALGRRALPVALDVRDLDSIDKATDKVMAEYGRIDILVNNAGCNVRKPTIEMSGEEWDMVLDTNLKGAFFMCASVAKKSMLKQKYGRIINIGSGTSKFGSGGIGPYCASRGGIRQLTQSLADEWGNDGINVNTLGPGWFKTEQTRVLYENQAWVDYIVDRIPKKRVGKPEDLAGMAVFLASEASEYVTGQLMMVDGGLTTGAMKVTV